MHRFVLSLVALSLVAGVSTACDDDDDLDPSPNSSVVRFTATLLPGNERPTPVTGAEATGSGVANITFNVTRDSAGNITAATADFNVTLTGFPSTTAITIAHIHTGGPEASSGILVDTGLTSGTVQLINGAGSFSRTNIQFQSLDIPQNIINNPNGFYFNVHSSANPGGVVRGQLVLVS